MATKPKPKPKRYYLIRTPYDLGTPMTCGTDTRMDKRTAIQVAKLFARDRRWRDRTPVRRRRVSVYTVNPGQRPTLLYQCHLNRKTGAVVSEVL